MKKKLPSCCLKAAEKGVIPVLDAGIHLRKSLCCKEIDGAVPKVMSVALIELVEMTATLNVVVSINSTTVMQTYWTAPMAWNG